MLRQDDQKDAIQQSTIFVADTPGYPGHVTVVKVMAEGKELRLTHRQYLAK